MALTQTAAPNLGERLRCLAATTQSLLEQYELAAPQVHLIEDKQNTTYRVETAGGRERFFFRLTPTRVASSEELASELLWLRALDQNGIVVPTPVATRDGSWVSTTSAPAARVAPDSHIGALFRWLPGRQLDGSRLQPAEGERIGQLLAHLHRVGGGFEPGAELARPRRDAEQWFGTAEVIPTGLGEPLLDRQHRRILDETADVIRRRLSELGMDPEIYGLTHTDLEPDNLLLDGSRLYPIDFADCGWSYYLYDLAAALLPMASRPDFPQLKAAFVRGYQRVRRLPEAHLQDLDLFLVARGMFSMRLIVQHFWDDTRRRGYAERMFPYIMGEVRRFLIAHRRRPGSPGSPQRSDRETAHLTTVQLLDHLRQLGARVSSKGGRLKLNAPSGALTAELRRELGERKAEILEFLEHAKTAADSRRQQRIPRLQQRVEAPLSFAQNRLWLIHQLNPASSVYNIFAALRLQGRLHIDALRATLGALVARHESLRTTFAVSGRAEPRQRIAATQKLTLHQVDLETLVERDGTSRRIIEQTIRQPFDLERGPLLRVLLLRHTSREHMLVLSMHHIISDGWSIGILIRELSLLYRAFVERRPDPLPALEVQYADFASWQRHQLTGAALEAQLDYWRRQLEGAPSVLTLPSDRPRPRRQRDRGASRTRLLPPRLSDDLQLLAQRTDTTLFMVLLAAYQILLSRLSGQGDVVVGSPIAHRQHPQVEGLIGFFVNTLALRSRVTHTVTGIELLGQVRETTLAAYAHQDLPFEHLVEVLAPERSTSHTPIFQTFFALQNTPRPALEMAGLTLEPMVIERSTSQFDLILTAQTTSSGLPLALRYATDLFDGTTISRWLEQFAAILGTLSASPAARIADLPHLPESGRHQLLVEWNATPDPPASTLRVATQIARVASLRADTVALTDAGSHWSYGYLESRAEGLAATLSDLGAGPERVVAVCMQRSATWVCALYAILKSGAAYLPMDPGYPASRLRFMQRDSEAPVLVTEPCFLNQFDDGQPAAQPGKGSCRIVVVDETAWETVHASRTPDQPATAHPTVDGLAYVIYTSGSTGRPKGVEVRYRGLEHLIAWHQRRFRIRPCDRAAQIAGPAFDASVWEIWPYLTAGASLHLPDEATRLSATEVKQWLTRKAITLAFLPTPLAEIALQESWAASSDGGLPPQDASPETRLPKTVLRTLLTGGDKLHQPPSTAIPFEVVNNYGPTENSVVATSGSVLPVTFLPTAKPPAKSNAPAIGRPIDGVDLYLVDDALRLRPQGAGGELSLGGDNLARGYRRRPALTAEQFVPDPFSGQAGSRLYRTGDLVRYRADGEVLFLGRNNAQVQIRGFRVELGEIEAALARAPNVAECAVIVQEDSPGERRLVGYVSGPEACRGSSLRLADVRDHLEQRLPAYMVPVLVELETLPLTPNGKVDRRALPKLEASLAENSGDSRTAAPQTAVYELTMAAMSKVLGLEQVPPNTSFFELGGHSLLGTQLISRLRTLFGIALPLGLLFDNPTAVQLARAIERLQAAARSDNEPPITARRHPHPDCAPMSFAQERMWFLDRLDPGSPVLNMPFAMRLVGELDLAILASCLAEINRRHEVLRTTLELREGQPVQIVHPWITIELPVIDLSSLSTGSRSREANRIQRGCARHAFDLARGPLWLVRLLRLGPENRLLMTFHHSIADGWSMAVLSRELVQLYSALIDGAPSPLEELGIQYADYAAWQRRWLESPAAKREIAYWRHQLDGLDGGDLLRCKPRPSIQSYRGERLQRDLSPQLTEAIRDLVRQSETTLFIVLLAALATLLHRWSGRDRIAIGAPIAGREPSQLEPLIGVFLNTLVLRLDLDAKLDFRQLLERARGTALEAYAHQRVPFEKLLQDLAPARDLSRTPMFQVFLNVLNLPSHELEIPGLRLEPVRSGGAAAKFDLTLYVEERDRGLRLQWVYNVDLLSSAQIFQLAAQFEGLLEAFTHRPDDSIYAPSLRRPEAAAKMLDLTTPPPPPQWNGSVIERFHRWVREAPELAAVVDNQDTWTYGALATASRAVADQLRALGTEPGDWILIQGQRDPSLIWALLGIMQTGARFTILDGEEPAARFLACLGTSDVDPGLMPHPPRGVVQLADPCDPTASPDRTLEEALDQAFFLRLPRRPEASSRSEHRYATSAPNALPAVDPDAPAYVAFTSGSSGRPKGIVGSQRPLAHFLDWSCSTFGFGPGDRFSLLSGLAHDPLLRDIFTPLVCGGTVSIPPPGWRRQPETLAAWLRDAKITVTHLAPAWGQLLLATGSPGPMHLEQVFFGGEALSIKLADRFARWAPNARINNFYGATETPQAIAWHAIAATPTLPVAKSAGEENRAYSTTTAPIGRGIDGVELHVMAPSGQPAGIGERGEIWVRTPYLALGYRNAEPTNGFIINPVTGDPSDRLYRTGDFGYIQPDGSVQYLGRGDDQMSIRGFRVEPAEIAAVALGHPAVRDIAVVGRPSETGASRLVVYVEPEEGATLSTVELRHFLADRLPPYMIPVACVVLDCLPRNARGKVDRDALPEPADVEPRRLGVPPRNSDERTVADIFEHLLEVRGVQATDEFFSLGGHSLQTILLVEKLVERFGRRLPLSTVFRAATVERLAALMRLPAAPTSSSFDTDASPLVALQTGGQQTPLFFVHAIGGTAMAYRELAGALGDRRPFYGLEARDSIGATLETMAHQYLDALRHVTPRGPYLLGGWSFGGVLAFEMARQIEAAGETVDLLLLVDAFAPRLDDRRQVSEQDLRAAFHRDLARQGGLPEGIDASLFEPYFAIFRSHHEAILRYHPAGPVAARTLLFEASERPDLPPLVEGWRPWLRSEPTVEQVAGDHYSLLSLPSVTTLASRIAASLNARTFQPRAATGTRPHER